MIPQVAAEELLVAGVKYYAATGPLSNVRDTESNWNNPRIHPNGRPMPVGDHAPVNGGRLTSS